MPVVVVERDHSLHVTVVVKGHPQSPDRLQGVVLSGKVDDVILDKTEGEDPFNLVVLDVAQIMRERKHRPKTL